MEFIELKLAMNRALKARDKFRKDTISSLIDAVNKASITKNGRVEISSALVDEAILKEKKTMQEMIDTCPASRDDLLNVYVGKMTIIKEFAPKICETREEVKDFMLSLGIDIVPSKRGEIMKAAKGKCDMKIANEVFKELTTK